RIRIRPARRASPRARLRRSTGRAGGRREGLCSHRLTRGAQAHSIGTGWSYIPARNIIDIEAGVSGLGTPSVYSLRCRVMFALCRSLLVQVDQVAEAVGNDGVDAAVVHACGFFDEYHAEGFEPFGVA